MKTRLQTCIDSIQCAYSCDLKSWSSPPWCFSVLYHCCACGHKMSQLAWRASFVWCVQPGLAWPPVQHLCAAEPCGASMSHPVGWDRILIAEGKKVAAGRRWPWQWIWVWGASSRSCQKEVNVGDVTHRERQMPAFRQLIYKNFQTMYSTSGRRFPLYVFDK